MDWAVFYLLILIIGLAWRIGKLEKAIKNLPKQRFRLVDRVGTSSDWREANPVLSVGEYAIDRNNGRLKVGNGVTPWKDLPYL